jgi:predicted GTPase
MVMADIAIINKVDTAEPEDVARVRSAIVNHAPKAEILLAESPVVVSDPSQIRGKRVVVVEDGPTLTHGGMAYGAGVIAAKTFGAAEIVDPRPHALRTIRKTFESYPHLGNLLPAMGYGPTQIKDLEQTINAVPCDTVVFATPIQLTRILSINKTTLRVRYEYKDHGEPTLEEVLLGRLEGVKVKR